MGVKFLVARVSIFKKDSVFLVTDQEESRLRSVLADKNLSLDLIASGDPSTDQGFEQVSLALRSAGTLIVSAAPAVSVKVLEAACKAHLEGVRVLDFETALFEIDPSVSASAEFLNMLARRGTFQDPSIRAYVNIKNMLEPIIAALALMILSPVVLVTALLIKLTSPGPVFYRQTRAGLRGKPFDMFKFRSMRIDAEASGPVWASAKKDDSRLTPIGGVLRSTHIDEIPQLWNVVRGELSIVGPRPERPIFIEKLEKEVPMFRMRLLVKPGCTGWAQIHQGYANSVDDSRRKLEYDLFYIIKHSFWLDFQVVLGTFGVLVSGGTEGRKRGRMAPVTPRRAFLPGFGTRVTTNDGAAREVVS